MKNQKIACITLDLEPDYAGRVDEDYDAWQHHTIERLLKILDRYGVPLTAFVVGKSIGKNTISLQQLQKHHTEFHLHSYSHHLSEPDSLKEIRMGVMAYRNYFKKKPVGYRAPEGRISPSGCRALAHEGFRFDASVMPSFWPSPSYLTYPALPYKTNSPPLVEIPYSTFSPVKIPCALSWMKLLGWNMTQALMQQTQLPDIMVFGCHLHDLYTPRSYGKLPLFWKMIYARNRNNGRGILNMFLRFLKGKQYQFVTLNNIVQ